MTSQFSLIIPTLNAERELASLLDCVSRQSIVPNEVIVIDSSSDDKTIDIASRFDAKVIVVEREEFNHGLTRDKAFRASHGDIVCFLTQDAVIYGEKYFETLLSVFLDSSVALATGRQMPKPDARRFEQLIRQYNYSDKSNIRSKEDIPKYGFKTYFASDVCSAYRRSYYLQCGGFDETDMAEDKLIAAKFIHAGLKVAYVADACVLHSHNFSFSQQYLRNKADGYIMEKYSQRLVGSDEISAGSKLAKVVAIQLAKEGRFIEVARFGVDCAARLLGSRAGRRLARKEGVKSL